MNRVRGGHELDVLLAGLEHRRRGAAPRGPHRLRALCAALGSPETAYPHIRVVGTAGKSSVTRMIAALARTQGVPVGAVTSPHLRCATERIVVDGVAISREGLARVLAHVLRSVPHVEAELGEPVTYFEVLTAAAWLHFATVGVDVAIVEAGIGGLGDATAAAPAALVVLTPVACDHAELGATPAAVAREKLGVLPAGGSLVTGPQDAAVLAVVAELATERDAVVWRDGPDHGVIVRERTPDGQRVLIHGPAGDVLVELPLLAPAQADNAATALTAWQVWCRTGVPEHTAMDPDTIRAAFAGLRIPARIERWTTPAGVQIVVDVAHDRSSMQTLADTLRERPVVGRTHLVLVVRGDRDPTPWCAILDPVVDTVVLLDARTDVADSGGLAARTVLSRLVCAASGDRVVVTGSHTALGTVRERVRVATSPRERTWPVDRGAELEVGASGSTPQPSP